MPVSRRELERLWHHIGVQFLTGLRFSVLTDDAGYLDMGRDAYRRHVLMFEHLAAAARKGLEQLESAGEDEAAEKFHALLMSMASMSAFLAKSQTLTNLVNQVGEEDEFVLRRVLETLSDLPTVFAEPA
jgi:hypothetical protein